MADAPADIIVAHWPEKLHSAWVDVVYCACGQEFRDDTGDDDTVDRWAAHLAQALPSGRKTP